MCARGRPGCFPVVSALRFAQQVGRNKLGRPASPSCCCCLCRPACRLAAGRAGCPGCPRPLAVQGNRMGWLAVAFGFGLSFGVTIMMFGYISAHLNPATCLALWVMGKVRREHLVPPHARRLLTPALAEHRRPSCRALATPLSAQPACLIAQLPSDSMHRHAMHAPTRPSRVNPGPVARYPPAFRRSPPSRRSPSPISWRCRPRSCWVPSWEHAW